MTPTRVYGFDNEEAPKTPTKAAITSQRLFRTKREATKAFAPAPAGYAGKRLSEKYSTVRMCDESGIYGHVSGYPEKEDFDLEGVEPPAGASA